MSVADNECWHHIWFGELRQNILFNRCQAPRRASSKNGVRHWWIEMHNSPFDWLQLQAVSDMWKILQWEKLTRNNHCRKNVFLYRQIRYFIAQLPRNSLFWPRNYREIRHFDHEITAKFAILAAKLPRNRPFCNCAVPRNLGKKIALNTGLCPMLRKISSVRQIPVTYFIIWHLSITPKTT